MATDHRSRFEKDFHVRLFQAWKNWEAHHGRQLTQQRFGEMVGKFRGKMVGQSSVSQWRNEILPSVEDVYWIAKCLEISPAWLAFGMGEGPGNSITTMVKPLKR